jgi:hypothetical protein
MVPSSSTAWCNRGDNYDRREETERSEQQSKTVPHGRHHHDERRRRERHLLPQERGRITRRRESALDAHRRSALQEAWLHQLQRSALDGERELLQHVLHCTSHAREGRCQNRHGPFGARSHVRRTHPLLLPEQQAPKRPARRLPRSTRSSSRTPRQRRSRQTRRSLLLRKKKTSTIHLRNGRNTRQEKSRNIAGARTTIPQRAAQDYQTGTFIKPLSRKTTMQQERHHQ